MKQTHYCLVPYVHKHCEICINLMLKFDTNTMTHMLKFGVCKLRFLHRFGPFLQLLISTSSLSLCLFHTAPSSQPGVQQCVCVSVWVSEAMSDPRDIDEDAILKGLSPEELDQLEFELQEMDPEVRAVVIFQKIPLKWKQECHSVCSESFYIVYCFDRIMKNHPRSLVPLFSSLNVTST